MAIVQISRISNRSGLTEDLPQLYGAELGWCTDSRRLFIGNGTLEQGAPVIGNTEILTEFSDITVLSSYTYEDIAVGYAAQTGPTSSDPVVRTIQAKLDDQACVRDFGAVGNGVADDTDAINRALYQLYCIANNTQVRRSLFFPAGTYRVTETIVIPTYAKLVGEGADSSIIFLDTSEDISSLSAYVARYGDSRQQTGANIGTNGAVPPRNIEISSMGFHTSETTDVFLVETANQCWFHSVSFRGPLTVSALSDPGFNPGVIDTAGVRVNTAAGADTEQITFDLCAFSGTTYGLATGAVFSSSTVSNSKFETLYQGIVLSDDVTGFRAVHNVFNDIVRRGIYYNDCALSVSAYNAFYNVANGIGTGTPQSSVVEFVGDTFVSVGDLFSRSDADDLVFPRVLNNVGTASSGAVEFQLGLYSRQGGKNFSLVNNASNQIITQLNSNYVKAAEMVYTIARGSYLRRGKLIFVSDSVSPVPYSDDFTDSGDTGVTFSVTQVGTTISVIYSTTNTGAAGTLAYSIDYLA